MGTQPCTAAMTMYARFRCPRCQNDLLDPHTPLHPLDPTMVADLARAHDNAEHSDWQPQETYDAIAASVAMLQAQHQQ